MGETIKEKIDRFYSLIKNYEEGAPDTRYKSWEWCHQAFMKKKDDTSDKNIEFLSLHLAFYLASWGMYRGSSYLLQRDYKAHKKAVRHILDSRYKDLWNYKPDYNNIEKANKLLFDEETGIYWKVKGSYSGYCDDSENEDESTDTLTTKILMGTFGCIPAFDRFLKRGIRCYCENNEGRKTKIGGYKLTQSIESKDKNKKDMATESFKALASLAVQHSKEFNVDSEFTYPPMKCVDMYLWEVGYEMDISDTLKSENKKISNKTKEKLRSRAVSLNYCDDQLSFEETSKQISQLNTN